MRKFVWQAIAGALVPCFAFAQASAPTTGVGRPATSANAASSPPADDSAQALGPLLKQFVDVLSTVQTQAADGPPIDKMIYEGAIPSMLRELDPHTQFFDPAQFQQLQQMEQSEQKGFGSVVSVLPGRVIFLQTLPGTPSNKAGIQPGDELLAVGNVPIAPLDPPQIIGLLTEARQHKVSIYIRREGYPKVLQFTLTPALVDSPSVDRAFMLQPSYGYIRVASWDLDTAKQLQDAITKLGGNSLQGLVLDLRNNPGGIVKAALEGASLFLQPGQRILTARGRTGIVQTADVPKTAQPYTFKLSVIVDEKTASASEILSGALQDHDRAVVVGEPSYGKGLVQSVVPLSNGAGLAITTAFYYTPSGRSIQKPLQNSTLSDTFNGNTSSHPAFETDKGRRVIGGGGIQPDIVVGPRDRTPLEAVLDGSGAITSFATQYLGSHPSLSTPFEVTPTILDDFKVYLSARRIQPSASEWTAERTWVSHRLKEEVITQAKGVEQGDEIAAHWDPQTQAALKAIDSNQPAITAAAR